MSTGSAHHAPTRTAREPRARGLTALGWVVLSAVCLILGLVVPGLGFVIAVGFALTSLKGNRRAQVVCLAIGVASVLLWVLGWYGLQAGGDHGGTVAGRSATSQ